MGDPVGIELDVSAEAAEVLRDPAKRAAMGRTVSLLATDEDVRRGLLFSALRATQADAEAAVLTDEGIERELAAHKADRGAGREPDRQRGAA